MKMWEKGVDDIPPSNPTNLPTNSSQDVTSTAHKLHNYIFPGDRQRSGNECSKPDRRYFD